MSVVPGSVRLDPHKLDHLSPLLGFVGDELAEVDGRACERDAPKFCEARLQFGIDEAGIDLFAELFHDLGGCVLWYADAVPLARLTHSPTVAWPARAFKRVAVGSSSAASLP